MPSDPTFAQHPGFSVSDVRDMAQGMSVEEAVKFLREIEAKLKAQLTLHGLDFIEDELNKRGIATL